MKAFLTCIAGLLLSTFLTQNAYAAAGTLIGFINFKSELTNYCSTSPLHGPMNCTGSMFPSGESNMIRGVADMLLYVVDENGSVIGFGSTTGEPNDSGYYEVPWYRPTMPTRLQLRQVYEHKDSRWKIQDPNGIGWQGVIATIVNPANGNYTVGVHEWSVPEHLNHVHEAVRMTWKNALQYSGDMINKYGRDPVSGLATPMRFRTPNSVPSYAAGSIVYVYSNDFKQNLSISHEIGHTVDHLQNPLGPCGVYNYPAPCSGAGTPASCTSGGHDFSEGEYYCSSFTEGWAYFIAAASVYGNSAQAPTICAFPAPCGLLYNIATSLGTSCSNTERRNELQVVRYLWDTYDTVADPGWSDTVPSVPGTRFAAIVNNLDLFPVGFGNGQQREAYASDGTIDAPDGRSALDWRDRNNTVENTNSQFANNCSPGN